MNFEVLQIRTSKDFVVGFEGFCYELWSVSLNFKDFV